MKRKPNCDKCVRRKQCTEEGRLLTYYTLDDDFMDPAYEKDGIKAAHGTLGIGQECPRMKGEKEYER